MRRYNAKRPVDLSEPNGYDELNELNELTEQAGKSAFPKRTKRASLSSERSSASSASSASDLGYLSRSSPSGFFSPPPPPDLMGASSKEAAVNADDTDDELARIFDRMDVSDEVMGAPAKIREQMLMKASKFCDPSGSPPPLKVPLSTMQVDESTAGLNDDDHEAFFCVRRDTHSSMSI